MNTVVKPIMSLPSFLRLCRSVDKIDREVRENLYKENLFNHHVPERYPYIPFTEWERLYSLFSAIRNSNVTFRNGYSLLDVGAGTGRIVYLAKRCGIPAKGIEFHSPYVEAGRKAYKLSEEELIVKDAFDLEPEFLGSFRVVYTYMPIRDEITMTNLHLSMVRKILESPAEKYYNVTFVEMLPRYYPMDGLDGTREFGTWFPKEITGILVRSGARHYTS